MEIPRIDPYLARWSSDSVIALANDVAGLQFLSLNAETLLNGDGIKWIRTKAPADMPKDRIIDMHWSPTMTSSNAGCVLAAVMHTGVVAVLENDTEEARIAYIIDDSHYTAVNWSGQDLLLGDASGILTVFNGTAKVASTKINPRADSAIKYIASSSLSNGKLAVVFADNSTWILENEQWTQMGAASRFNVIAADILPEDQSLITLECGRIRRNNEKMTTSSCLPGYILTSAATKGLTVVHANGKVSDLTPNSSEIALPQIQGDVLAAQLHPNLPMGMVILGIGSAANYSGSSTWKFPILSSQNAAIYLFPTAGKLGLPRRIHYDMLSAWLAFLIHPQRPTADNFDDILKTENSLLKEISSLPLDQQLQEVFHSELFDVMRFKWFMADPDGRENIVKSMRRVLATVLNKFPPTSPLDELIVTLYNRSDSHSDSQSSNKKNSETFTLGGDNIVDTFELGNQQDPAVLKSTNGRLWKRCSLTLLPLLKLECYQSYDKSFTKYRDSPTDLNEKKSETNPIASALLEASQFCIYNGTSWQ